MTGDELRLVRLTLNLSLREMAQALRCGVRSLERLESGEWVITGSQALLAGLFLNVPGSIEFALRQSALHVPERSA